MAYCLSFSSSEGTKNSTTEEKYVQVVAVGFNTLRYDVGVGVLNPPHE
ncbi:hypothetical protein E4N83_01540 [Treponema denticola]|nr:hypothetical protein E4N83_01540 [Treponema denticola]